MRYAQREANLQVHPQGERDPVRMPDTGRGACVHSRLLWAVSCIPRARPMKC